MFLHITEGQTCIDCTSLISVSFLFLKDPSVAVELTHNRKEEVIQKHQTKAGKKDLTINEEFSFEVATNSSCTLENFGVQFTVFQHEFMHRNEVIGHVRLGLDAPFPSEINHWKAVTLSPHKPIQGWHKLHGPLWMITCLGIIIIICNEKWLCTREGSRNFCKRVPMG